MINQEQTIPCPVCGSKIYFDTRQLLLGVQFPCPNASCGSTIGLPAESKPIVQETMEKFEELKRSVAKK